MTTKLFAPAISILRNTMEHGDKITSISIKTEFRAGDRIGVIEAHVTLEMLNDPKTLRGHIDAGIANFMKTNGIQEAKPQ